MSWQIHIDIQTNLFLVLSANLFRILFGTLLPIFFAFLMPILIVNMFTSLIAITRGITFPNIGTVKCQINYTGLWNAPFWTTLTFWSGCKNYTAFARISNDASSSVDHLPMSLKVLLPIPATDLATFLTEHNSKHAHSTSEIPQDYPFRSTDKYCK